MKFMPITKRNRKTQKMINVYYIRRPLEKLLHLSHQVIPLILPMIFLMSLLIISLVKVKEQSTYDNIEIFNNSAYLTDETESSKANNYYAENLSLKYYKTLQQETNLTEDTSTIVTTEEETSTAETTTEELPIVTTVVETEAVVSESSAVVINNTGQQQYYYNDTAIPLNSQVIYSEDIMRYHEALNYVSESDRILLCNIVAYEYGSNWVPIEDKAKVVAVIMNRVNRGSANGFRDSIYEVLTQPGQFVGYHECEGFNNKVLTSVVDAVDYYFANINTFDQSILYFEGDGTWNYFH